jgi:multiple sugar transport system ATP-binding protein
MEGHVAGIRLKSIVKNFDETPVLKGVDLDIRDGEFLTLVGPSGCGKSTLLRIISGLEEQNSGDVEIDGRVVNHVRPSNRDLAMVFQSYALYPHLSVSQNIATPLRLRDLSFWERMPIFGYFVPGRRAKIDLLEQAVVETAHTLQIEHLLDRKPNQLSGGQRQRVALGRAMVRKPVAFLMDEPLSNLDAALRVHMRAELAELHRNLGITFIYVTHDQAEALTMSDRLAVMMDGQIHQLGTPDEIYKDPQDRFVAEFIGSPKINFLPGQVDVTGDVSILGARMGVKIAKNEQRVHVGIRPEHFNLSIDDPDQGNWPFLVTHKENLGSDIFLHGQLDGFDDRVIARATPEEASEIQIGSTIGLNTGPEALKIFDEKDRRIEVVEG